MPLSLQSLARDQALDLGCLGVRLGTLLLGRDLAADDELSHIVLLGQVEELADVCGYAGMRFVSVAAFGC